MGWAAFALYLGVCYVANAIEVLFVVVGANIIRHPVFYFVVVGCVDGNRWQNPYASGDLDGRCGVVF
jgi:hypothetical protein